MVGICGARVRQRLICELSSSSTDPKFSILMTQRSLCPLTQRDRDPVRFRTQISRSSAPAGAPIEVRHWVGDCCLVFFRQKGLWPSAAGIPEMPGRALGASAGTGELRGILNHGPPDMRTTFRQRGLFSPRRNFFLLAVQLCSSSSGVGTRPYP